jgi:hypothetical protein
MDPAEQGDWLFVPDAEPIRVTPVALVPEMDGFRIAHDFDGVTEDRQPRISAERGYVTDPAEKQRLLDYLRGGTVAVHTAVAGDDLLDPRRRFAVRGTGYTDGVWIWGGGAEYYLTWHDVAPEPEFYQHIREQGYRAPAVSDDVLAAARQAVSKAGRRHSEETTAWLREHGLLNEGDPERFGAEVNQRLMDIGWFKGRDVSEQVDPWLDHWARTLPKFRLTERGFPECEPLPAATAVLREFGGLANRHGGPGVTSARARFAIYPQDGGGDLARMLLDVAELSARLDKRLFQIGEFEDGTSALVVAEDGAVYIAGAAELFYGDSFDTALNQMLLGYEPEEI